MSPEDILALGYIQSDYDDMCEPGWLWKAIKLHVRFRNIRPWSALWDV